MGEKWKSCQISYFGAPKSMWMVTLAMKLRHLLLGRTAMTKLDSILKSRDITLPTKVHIAKAMVFPIFLYGCERWTIKMAECWRIKAFGLWCWRRLWESFVLQGDQTSQSLTKSVLNIHWKDWWWSWNCNTLAIWCKEPTYWKKALMLGKIEGRRRRVWWMSWLDGIIDSMDMSLSKLREMVK